jgi:hypothetical protein
MSSARWPWVIGCGGAGLLSGFTTATCAIVLLGGGHGWVAPTPTIHLAWLYLLQHLLPQLRLELLPQLGLDHRPHFLAHQIEEVVPVHDSNFREHPLQERLVPDDLASEAGQHHEKLPLGIHGNQRLRRRQNLRPRS